VEVRITPDLMGNGDERLLRIALENLLNNAWKIHEQTAATTDRNGLRGQDGQRVFFVRDTARDSTWPTPTSCSARFNGCIHSTARYPQGEIKRGAMVNGALRPDASAVAVDDACTVASPMPWPGNSPLLECNR